LGIKLPTFDVTERIAFSNFLIVTGKRIIHTHIVRRINLRRRWSTFGTYQQVPKRVQHYALF
jgi:hypothetical protein